MPAPRFLPTSRRLVAACLWAAASAASAHDTWFEPRQSAKPSELVLALGTGNQFPQLEFPIGAEQLRGHGCRRADAETALPLKAVQDTPTALILRAETQAAAPVSCWAQTMPFDIELAPGKIKLYLKEIQPPRAVLEAWAGMQSRGVPWKERYTKHARIELAAGGTAQPRPVGMGMDVLLESGLQAARVGDPLVFRVLRDGQPLPDFAVELRSDRNRIGIWRRTDAEGRVRIEAPLAGHWVLRGTDLRLSTTEPDTWESRFVTLAFEVAP